MPENLSLFYEDIYGAMRGFVSYAGGSKVIGPLVFPTKGVKAAGWLDDCLNPDRSAKLDPEEVMHMLKLARERGFHGLMCWIGDETDYEVKPREPKDELASLYAQYVDCAKEMKKLSERIERTEVRTHSRVTR